MIFRLADEDVKEMRGCMAITVLNQVYKIIRFDLKTNEWILLEEDVEVYQLFTTIKGD